MKTAILSLVPDQVPDVYAWRDLFVAEQAAGAKGRVGRFMAIADRTGTPWRQVRKKFYAFAKDGLAGLVDRRGNSALWNTRKPAGLPEEDQALVKTWCETWQRSSEAAIRALRTAWLEQRVPDWARDRGLAVPQTTQLVDIHTGYPIGWSVRNLMNYAPSEYELKAARIGRSAAAAHRPLVYTTRRELRVGQFRLWDDMWHDHMVVDFDQRRRGRPLEFHGLDLASGCKVAWGMRTRTQREDGSHDGLKGGDFRFLLASHYAGVGYHPEGTTEVVEHGTASIPDWLEQLLADATGGAIRVARSGMEGATAHSGQYAGRAKGNFRFKAALESLGNLIHNEMAALPGQVGRNRDHSPEQMHEGGRLVDQEGRALAKVGLLKHADALVAALSQLPAERAAWLRFPLLMMHQFRLVAEEVYARINGRTEHDLEGWDDRWTHDERAGRMRRLSPAEVYAQGRGAMRPLDSRTIALILAGGDGLETLGRERTTRSGMFELQDGEISGDVLRFDAAGLGDREKYLTILNPFDPGRMWVYDAMGGFVSEVKRIYSVNRADSEAVQRRMGEAAKTEAGLLQPLRERHAAEARERLARHENNAEVLGRARGGESRLPADAAAAIPDEAEGRPGEADADELAARISDLL